MATQVSGGLGEHGRHLALLAHSVGHALEERANRPPGSSPASMRSPASFGRCSVERVADRRDDLGDRLVERRAHSLGVELHRPREPGGEIASADLDLDLVPEGGPPSPASCLMSSAVWWPIRSWYSRLQKLTMASSISSPPTADGLGEPRCRRARSPRPSVVAAADVDDQTAGRLADREGRSRSRPPSAPRSGRPRVAPAPRQASSTARFLDSCHARRERRPRLGDG